MGQFCCRGPRRTRPMRPGPLRSATRSWFASCDSSSSSCAGADLASPRLRRVDLASGGASRPASAASSASSLAGEHPWPCSFSSRSTRAVFFEFALALAFLLDLEAAFSLHFCVSPCNNNSNSLICSNREFWGSTEPSCPS